MDLNKIKLELTPEQKKQVVVGIIGAAVVLWSYFNYLLGPIRKDIATQTAELTNLTGQLNQAKARAARRDMLQRELANLETELKATEAQLPRTKELPDLLRFITRTAEAYRVSVSRFDPKSSQAGQGGYFDQIPFGITLTANYHDLARFLTDIGMNVRILKPDNLQLTGQQSENADTIGATLDLIAYTYRG